jgi:hypothetical protein
MAAGFSALAGHIPGISDTKLAGRMLIGGVASKLGGGEFANGALSAAFEYLYNWGGTCLSSGASCASWDKPHIEMIPTDRKNLYNYDVYATDTAGRRSFVGEFSLTTDVNVCGASGCPGLAPQSGTWTFENRPSQSSVINRNIREFGGVIRLDGNWVTNGENPAQQGRSVANGLAIHAGFPSGTGSANCITCLQSTLRNLMNTLTPNVGMQGTLTIRSRY